MHSSGVAIEIMDMYAYFTAMGLGEAPGIKKVYTMFVIEKIMPHNIFVVC